LEYQILLGMSFPYIPILLIRVIGNTHQLNAVIRRVPAIAHLMFAVQIATRHVMAGI